MRKAVIGGREKCDSGACLRRVKSDMESFISDWRVREWMRMEMERDLGSGLGFAMSAVVKSWIAVVWWFETQRRGIKRLILVNSSWVKGKSNFVSRSASLGMQVK